MDSGTIKDERSYRERLMGELWRYSQVMGALGQVETYRGCIWNDLGCISALNDVNHLAARLPMPHEGDVVEKINALLAQCRTPLIQDFPPEDVYSLMKLAIGEPATVALYGKIPVQLFDPPKVVNLRQSRVRSAAHDVIKAYMARNWPRDVTQQDMAEKLDRPLRFVQKNEDPRELRILDFLTFMRALGRNPTFSLKELAAQLEEALAKSS